MADSWTSERRQSAERGELGPEAQLKEYQRQLAWLPKWVAKTIEGAEQHRKYLDKRIAKLKHKGIHVR